MKFRAQASAINRPVATHRVQPRREATGNGFPILFAQFQKGMLNHIPRGGDIATQQPRSVSRQRSLVPLERANDELILKIAGG